MGKTVDQIFSEYGDRRTLFLGRNSDYWRLVSIYEGLFYDQMNARDIMDGQGRVTLRDNRRTDRSSPLVANLMKPIVDDYVSLTGVLPDIRVPAPDGDQEFADYMEKFHYGVWHASNMELQILAMAWWNSALGACDAIVWPNFRKKHAEIRFVGPDKVYGAIDMLDPFAYSSAIVVEHLSARSVRDYFPQQKVRQMLDEIDRLRVGSPGNFAAGRLELVRFFDKDEVVTILGHEETEIRGRSRGERKIEPLVELGRATHNLGFCPVVPFYNSIFPGNRRSVSDIEEAVGLNQYINFLLNSHEEGVKQELFAPLILEDAQKAPEDIDLGNPTEIIPLNAGGKAYRLATSGQATQTVGQEISRTQALVEYVTGTSGTRTQGRQPSSSIATGRSLEKAQGPQMSRVDVRNRINAQRLGRVNELCVLMTGEMFPDDQIEMFGTHSSKGGLFRFTIDGGKSLRGYTYNEVKYSPNMYMGFENRLTAVLQMMGAADPLADRRWAIEFMGHTDFPDEMMKRIDADMERRATQQAALAKAAQPQDPSAPKPLEQAVSLEAGATPKPGGQATPALPPTGEAAPGGQPPGAPGAAPRGDIGQISSGLGGSLADQIRSVIAQVALKGQVFMEVSGA